MIEARKCSADSQPSGTRDAAAGRASAAKVLVVLRALEQGGNEAGVAELARAAGLPKSTTHRMLTFLCEEGFASNAGGRYALTARMAGSVVPELEENERRLREQVTPYLVDLYALTQHPAALIVLSGEVGRVVSLVSGSRSARFAANLPSEVLLHPTAAGKVQPAHSHLEADLTTAPQRHTGTATTARDQLAGELAFARPTGIWSAASEWRPGVKGLAVTVSEPGRSRAAAIAVIGPTARFDVQAVAPHLHRVAHHVKLHLREFEPQSVSA